MAITTVRSEQLKDSSVKRDDLNTADVGGAVIRKVVAGTNITISYTGVDAGTGDVTINASGGGGATTFNQYTSFFDKTGPSSYATGGFIIDLTATYSSLNDFILYVKKGTRGNVPYGRFEYLLNSPTAGKVTVKVQKYQFERVSSFDNITSGSQPTGVTIQTVKDQISSAAPAHTHNIDHGHTATSSTMTAAGAGVDTDAVGPGMTTHTHGVATGTQAFTTGAASVNHTHIDNTIYQHQHTLTYVSTNVTVAELTNATNLSATTFICMVSGVRA